MSPIRRHLSMKLFLLSIVAQCIVFPAQAFNESLDIYLDLKASRMNHDLIYSRDLQHDLLQQYGHFYFWNKEFLLSKKDLLTLSSPRLTQEQFKEFIHSLSVSSMNKKLFYKSFLDRFLKDQLLTNINSTSFDPIRDELAPKDLNELSYEDLKKYSRQIIDKLPSHPFDSIQPQILMELVEGKFPGVSKFKLPGHLKESKLWENVNLVTKTYFNMEEFNQTISRLSLSSRNTSGPNLSKLYIPQEKLSLYLQLSAIIKLFSQTPTEKDKEVRLENLLKPTFKGWFEVVKKEPYTLKVKTLFSDWPLIQDSFLARTIANDWEDISTIKDWNLLPEWVKTAPTPQEQQAEFVNDMVHRFELAPQTAIKLFTLIFENIRENNLQVILPLLHFFPYK